MSSRWQHRSFLTTVPLTRRPTRHHPQTGHDYENAWIQRWSEIALWTTEIKKDHVIRVVGRTTLWLHCPSPRQSHLRGPYWAYSFSSGEEIYQSEHPLPPKSGCFPGCPLWSHSSQGSLRNSVGFDSCGSETDREGGWSHNNQCSGLGRPHFSPHMHESKDHRWWPHLARELSHYFCLISVAGYKINIQKPIPFLCTNNYLKKT